MPTPAWRTGTGRTACPISGGWRTAWPPTATTSCAAAPGPLVLERGPATNPLFGAFFDAAVQAGYPLTDDVNGYRQEGFAAVRPQCAQGAPTVRVPGLPAAGDAPEEPDRAAPGRWPPGSPSPARRATGVTLPRATAGTTRATAGEVILCGGAINSPQLLQLSGVGAVRTSCGRWASRRWSTCPGSAPTCRTTSRSTSSTPAPSRSPCSRTCRNGGSRSSGWSGSWPARGPAATNHFEGGGFVRSNDDVEYPNLMFHFLPIAVRYDGSVSEEVERTGHGYQVHVGPMYSDARGTLKITSTDPRRHPALRFNYLSTEQDRREWVEAIRVARDILGQPAMAPFNGGETSPGPSVSTDEEILDWVAEDAETALHPSCTAKMGPDSDPLAVVDPATMRVHGTQGLRVVDASVMPYVTNGNIYAPVMMLAEKAADLILGRPAAGPRRLRRSTATPGTDQLTDWPGGRTAGGRELRSEPGVDLK